MALKLRVSENSGIPWTQTLEYMSLCRTITRPGDPITYNPPHPQGYSSTDITQFQVGLAGSNISNLPDVMYQLWPNKEWWDHTKSAKPLPKRSANGNVLYERTPRLWAPRELLDYPILRNLDTISSEEEAWFLEMLLRIDGRIEWTDLLMRMEYPGYDEKDEQKVRNRLQQRMARFREKFVMVSWRDTAGDNNAIRDRVLDKLTPTQLAARGGLGSTRGSTPGSRDSQGRVIPVPGRRPAKTANTGPNMATHSTPLSRALPNRQRNEERNPTMGGAQQPYALTSHAMCTGAHPYFEASSHSPSHEATTTIMGGRRAPSDAETQTQHGQGSTLYAANQSMQQTENTLHAGPSETLREPNQPLSDEEDWDNKDFGGDGGDEGDDGDDEQGNGEGSDDYDDDDSDYNKEADVDMPSTEESPPIESLTPGECYELERYLKEDRIRMHMCLDGMISVDELMLDMQNNQAKLKQGLRRTRGETSDNDEAEELQGRRAKRTRREEGATASSSKPLSKFQEPTYNGFDDPQPGPWGGYRRQGALAKTSRFPSTRPVGSAVQRLHNDRLRRPPPKATGGQKDIYESLHYPQPELVMDEDWTVFHSHQPTAYPPQQLRVEESLYTNIEPRQGRLAPYESRQDSAMETRNPDTTAGERQPRPSSHHQHQPDGPPDGDNSYDSGSSANLEESARNEYEPTAPRRAHQQSATSTSQDDPFFPDELFNGMLNGQPQNNHIGSIYTRSQQQEIDEYYCCLMAPHPRPQAETNAREGRMPPPPRPRMQEHRTVHVADLLNPRSRPQTRQGGGVPQDYSQYNVPVAHAQPRGAQVTAGASQPADKSDPPIDATTSWNPKWSAFINFHDAEPLLRAHYPDEYPPVSPPGTP